MAHIGEKIKQRRVELGLSQRELAEKVGYSHHSTLTRIEAGTVDIPQSKIRQFASALNVDISYLMDTDNFRPDIVRATELLQTASPEQVAIIEEYMRFVLQGNK